MCARNGRADRTRPARVDDDMRAQYATLGVAIDLPLDDDDEGLELVIHNAASLSGFIACATQWRVVATMAGLVWIGLDYSACKIVLDQMELPGHVLTDLRAIEDTVLPILNETPEASG